MKNLKKILIPTDFSRCAQQALPQALYLAEKYQAELHQLHAIVLHAEDPHNPAFHFPNLEEIHSRLKELASQKMLAELEAQQANLPTIQSVQMRGITAAAVILEYAQDNDIDLIVMGTHGRRGLEHLLLGSVAEEVIRLASCPVLTIREKKQAMPVEALKKILVPLDFSEYSQQALCYAKEIAIVFSARLQLLHVIEETIHPSFYASGINSIFKLMPDIKAKTTTAMQNLLKETAGPPVEADFNILEGRAARDIVQFAEENSSDLIVIATHGLTGIEHFLLGSVAEKVVRRAPCPVFTVKAFGKSLI